MNKLLLIVQREFIAKVRNKSFIVMTFLSPLIFLGMSFLIGYLSSINKDEATKIAIYDQGNIIKSSLKSDKETAFTCGMMHSIGSLLIRMVMPKEAQHLDNAESLGGSKRHELENGQLGFTYAEVGAELAKRWKFPDVIQQAISGQNMTEKNETYSVEAGLIYIAKYLKEAHEKGLSEEDIVSGFPLAVADKIGLDATRAYKDLAATTDLNSGLDGLLE